MRNRVKFIGFTGLLVASVCLAVDGEASIYRYVDKGGSEHFVTDLETIPGEFRDQAELVAEEAPPIQASSATEASLEKSPAEQAIDRRIKQRMLERRRKNKLQNIEVYVTSWCPHCRNLERFLQSHRIPYKRYDIERDAAARKRHAQLNPRGGIPVIKIGDHVIFGNDQRAIIKYLNQ